jgi:hypothetical protein
MLQEDGGLAIIDWEFASWYPMYCEYSTATWSNSGWYDDWHGYVLYCSYQHSPFCAIVDSL